MKIIDFERKGNLVRYTLGDEDCTDYWGDDWNDAPYDCNAEEVYDEYAQYTIDVVYDYDWTVLEPCDGVTNCWFSKEDMKARKVPCIVVDKDPKNGGWRFLDEVTDDNNDRVYFEDQIPDITMKVGKTAFGGEIVKVRKAERDE